jgi:hypothetical protein
VEEGVPSLKSGSTPPPPPPPTRPGVPVGARGEVEGKGEREIKGVGVPSAEEGEALPTVSVMDGEEDALGTKDAVGTGEVEAVRVPLSAPPVVPVGWGDVEPPPPRPSNDGEGEGVEEGVVAPEELQEAALVEDSVAG